MKAVWIQEFGSVENLEIREVADLPKPTGTQVLVKVHAAGLNRADLLQRKGFYPAPKGFPERILGLEFAGEVAEIGENVTSFKTGDRVFGITAGGAQAEFLLTNEAELVEMPANLSFTEAAAVPEAFITAHDAIFTQADLQSGETLLIHAVGSGVGLAALQMAKAKGAKVFGTSRTADKLEKCQDFGLDKGILTDNDSVTSEPKYFVELVQSFTDSKGVDVILDLVGAKYFPANLESMALKGRLMLVGLTAGTKAEFNLGIALSKRLKIIGTVLRARSPEEKAAVTQAFARDIVPLLNSGQVRPNLDKVFDLKGIVQAHEYLESNQSFGKVVLQIQ